MTKALVTGANGFIGDYLVNRLLKEGWQVRVLIQRGTKLGPLTNLPIEKVDGDLSEIESLKTAVRDVDYIFHLAALKKAYSEAEYDAANYLGTKNLIEACVQSNLSLKRLIYMSTQAALGPAQGPDKPLNEETPSRPVSFYGSSKRKGELVVLESANRIPITIVRAPIVYGPKKKELFQVYKAAEWHLQLILGIFPKYISFCYVDDLIEGLWLAATKEVAKGQIYFIADETIYTDRQFSKTVAEVLGKWTIKVLVPDIIFDLEGWIKDMFLKIKGINSNYNRNNNFEMIHSFWICDPSKAIRELGFKAKVKLAEGIKRTADWYKANKWI